MKNEEKAVKLFQGVTDVGDDLIEEAGTVRKRKKMTPWRGAAIAACLCLALVGTAGAVAGVGGVHIKWLDGVAMREEDRSGYAVTDEGLTKFPLSCFPEEVLALGKEPNENGVNSGKKYFEFWEELEQLLGWKFTTTLSWMMEDLSIVRVVYSSLQGGTERIWHQC